MKIKLFDSELKVMEILWKEGELTAGEISKILKDEIGWNRNTTYTVIKKCIEKGAIQRIEPKFICRAVITRKEVQEYETEELIDRMFDGSKKRPQCKEQRNCSWIQLIHHSVILHAGE